MSGIERIAAERRRQIEKEGWTPERDSAYKKRELVSAAVCYALHDFPPSPNDIHAFLTKHWPWSFSWWKPTSEIRNLEKAGALIAAEIDRLEGFEKQMPYVPADERFLD